ncbi:hypothetical protein [uncultured Dokdonia sp.]|uniref:tetratricopeptide repeat protein n=1 Tax=uncultured Dokdonia sp. TaxID=575653 RepID=UPI00260A5687|nr:hypothetical protein [uncultured Dokdonia sp.]
MLKRLLIIVTMASISICCNFLPPEAYYEESFQYAENEDYKNAIISLDKAIELKPNFRPALYNRAYYKTLVNDTIGAIEDYKLILNFDPDNTAAYFYVGLNFETLGKHQYAVNYYNESLKTIGARKTHIDKNGNGLVINTNWRSKVYDNDASYNIDDIDIIYHKSISNLHLQNYDAVINDLSNVVKLNDYKEDAYLLLGKAYLGKMDTINSCLNLARSIRLGNQESRLLYRENCMGNN